MSGHPHGGKGSNQYQIRGHSTAQDHPTDIPHPDLMAQVQTTRTPHLNDRRSAKVVGVLSAETLRRLAWETRNGVVLDHLARIGKDGVADVVAGNTHTKPKTLIYLAHTANTVVRRSMAHRSDTPPEVLEVLASDQDLFVRRNVAQHANCPPEVLARLVQDRAPEVRRAAISHPRCPARSVLLRHQAAQLGTVERKRP